MPRGDQEIVVGKLVAPFGTSGEIKVIVLTEFPERLDAGKDIRVRDANGSERKFHIDRSRDHKTGRVLKLQNVDSREDAESLRACEIVIAPEELNPLADGSYYVFELIGLRVVSEDGREWGKVADVLQAGANDVYITTTGLCVPALKDVVAKIDLESGEMLIRAYPGLLPDKD